MKQFACFVSAALLCAFLTIGCSKKKNTDSDTNENTADELKYTDDADHLTIRPPEFDVPGDIEDAEVAEFMDADGEKANNDGETTKEDVNNVQNPASESLNDIKETSDKAAELKESANERYNNANYNTPRRYNDSKAREKLNEAKEKLENLF